MSELHKYLDDVPPLKGNQFYKCASCMHAKSKQRSYSTPSTAIKGVHQDTTSETTVPGQNFYMDFGFMRGSGYCSKDEEGRTITSIDGYRSYLIVLDKATRYLWVFLTKTKAPPTNILEMFLKEDGNPTVTRRTIRTDEESELWASHAFKTAALDAGYLLEPTASGAPFQNGLGERPNQTLGTMVRCLLHSANLGPEFWSYALVHAVYLKNRLPHAALTTTPYEAYTRKRPSARHLRVFGCPVIAKNPGKRPAKLDIHTSAG